MIRIELGKEVSPGMFEYAAPSWRLFGKSRQPLLDACRQLEAMGASPTERVGLFRNGRSSADLSCSVGVGAGLTVSERSKGSLSFEKYQPFDISLRQEAAE